MPADPAINQILDRDKAGRQGNFYRVVFACRRMGWPKVQGVNARWQHNP